MNALQQDNYEFETLEQDLNVSADSIAIEDADDLSDAPTVYDYLVERNLLGKLTEISLKKASVPYHLREDAWQAVQVKWCYYKVNLNFPHNRICAYASMLGHDEALRIRRTIGAVVALPNAMFSKVGNEQLKSSVFAKSLGAALNPIDINDMSDSREYAVEDDESLFESVSTERVEKRLRKLTLTKTQRKIALLICCNQMDIAVVAEQLNLTKAYVERMVSTVTTALLNYDEEMEAA